MTTSKSTKNEIKHTFYPKKNWKPTTIKLKKENLEEQKKEFFENFIAKREPCKLDFSELDEPLFKLNDLNLLKEHAGMEEIMVEKKVNGSFGSKEKRIKTNFKNFIEQLESGETDLYLTTQYSESSDDVENDSNETVLEDFLQRPLTKLTSFFSIEPKIFSTLIPQQINLWMGSSSREGSSSGLHHDFADNLYFLVKGTKKFTIFSPLDAKNLYTVGKIKKIFNNGLISYADEEQRSDGAFLRDVAEYNLEHAKEKLERLIENGKNKDEIEEAEAEVEEAMDQLLEYGYDIDEEEENGSFVDDFDGSFSEHSSDGEAAPNSSRKNFKKLEQELNQEVSSEPPSFSKIGVDCLRILESGDKSCINKIYEIFPLLKKCVKIEFYLEESQVLYLPAGWFHEVQSFGSTVSSEASIHIAFNYWHHPPSLKNSENPYFDNYWKDNFEKVKKKLHEKMEKKINVEKKNLNLKESNLLNVDSKKRRKLNDLNSKKNKIKKNFKNIIWDVKNI